MAESNWGTIGDGIEQEKNNNDAEQSTEVCDCCGMGSYITIRTSSGSRGDTRPSNGHGWPVSGKRERAGANFFDLDKTAHEIQRERGSLTIYLIKWSKKKKKKTSQPGALETPGKSPAELREGNISRGRTSQMEDPARGGRGGIDEH